MPPSQHGTDYDALARMKAGFAAYNHIGAHHGNHTEQPPVRLGDAGTVRHELASSSATGPAWVPASRE